MFFDEFGTGSDPELEIFEEFYHQEAFGIITHTILI
jgi:hypothetical protein